MSNTLTKVQNLYVLQIELWKVLDGEIKTEEQVKTAKKNLKEFKALLKEVDWKYMGGEDVLETLEQMRKEVEAKLKASSVVKKSLKKPTSAKATAGKPAAKKKTATKAKAKKVSATKKKTTKKTVKKKK